MANLNEALPVMFKQAILQGHTITGINTNILIPLFMEFIAYQIYQLAPMEFEEWIKTIPHQCKDPKNPLPEMTQAREDLFLTLEMVVHQ